MPSPQTMSDGVAQRIRSRPVCFVELSES
jgi:hypothetical protein